MKSYRVGNATISRLSDLKLDEIDPAFMLPASDPQTLAAERQRNTVDKKSVSELTGNLRQSIHAWVLRTPDRTIIIDTGGGSGKHRPEEVMIDDLKGPFLDELKAAGVDPEAVDTVLFTHLHADHVGWNTRKDGEQWKLTFPNARHVFSGKEKAYLAAIAAGDSQENKIVEAANLGTRASKPVARSFVDSVVPVIEAGLAQEIVVDGSEAVAAFAFHPTPGHSIDHASISFTSQGETAFFWGDVLHHPFQVVRPHWNSAFCEFPEAAQRSRILALTYAADTNALVFTTHFPDTSAGRVRRDGSNFGWEFE